jgi:hypothetical protein
MIMIKRMEVAGRASVVLIVVFAFVTASLAQITPAKLTDIPSGISPDPGVVINLKDPKNIVVATAPDRIFYSVDGGGVWKETKLTSRYSVRGGMKLISEVKGDLDVIHYCDALNPSRTNDRFILQSSEDKGATWKEEAVFGNSASKDDKEPKDQTNPSVAIHPKKRILYGVWTQSDKLGLNDPNCHSNILYGSWNGGKQWAKPVQINQNPGDCSGQENSAGGASIVMDLNEHLYATWSNQSMIYFDRSYDGEVWLSRDLAIGHPENMALNVPGFGPITSRPTLAVDEAPTKYHGSLYLVYTEGKKGSLDASVAMMRSTNHGDNWAAPTRFKKPDVMGQQLAPSIAVDRTTGHIFIACYERREYENLKTDVVLFYSKDGGNNFYQARITTTPFTPGAGNNVNPFTGISAHAGIIAISWTQIDDEKGSVWTAIVKEGDLSYK